MLLHVAIFKQHGAERWLCTFCFEGQEQCLMADAIDTLMDKLGTFIHTHIEVPNADH